MERKIFKDIINKQLLENGFSKEGIYYYKEGDDIICIVGLQKSGYSNGYYINIGYIIKKLHPSITKLRDVDGDIRTRFDHKGETKQTDFFDPEKFSDQIQLQHTLQENINELILSELSIEGIKNLLHKQPVMLYQTTIKAKNFLGFV